MLNLRHSSSPLNWTRTYLYNNVGPRGRQKCNDMQPCIQTEDCRPQFRQYIEGVYGGFLAGVFEKYLGAPERFLERFIGGFCSRVSGSIYSRAGSGVYRRGQLKGFYCRRFMEGL